MLAGLLGIAGLVLALFAVGGFMEGDMGKVAKFGAGFVVCAVMILLTATPRTGIAQDCHVEWDGRSNSEVCG